MENLVLKQGTNRVAIKGYLKSMKLSEGNNKKLGDYISGSVVIITTPGNEVVIDCFAKKYAGDGTDRKESKSYKALKGFMENGVSMASLMSGEKSSPLSKEEALSQCSKIVTTGSLTKREYYNDNGDFISKDSISSNFFTIVGSLEKTESTFSVDCYIRSIKEERRNGELTGRLAMDVYVPIYRGAIIPFTFMVPEEVANEVQNIYTPGETALLNGDCVNRANVVTSRSGGFGRANEVTTYVHELVLMGGDPPYHEGNANAFSPEAIKQAESVRLTEYLPNLEKKNEDRGNASSFSSGNRPSSEGFVF